jgi:hypothetical protein
MPSNSTSANSDETPARLPIATSEEKIMGISSQSWAPLAVVALLSSVVITLAQEAPIGTGAKGAAQSVSATCWERHWKVFTLIEELGELPEFQDHRLSEALLDSMHAHKLCAEGREEQALSIYNHIAHGLVVARLTR